MMASSARAQDALAKARNLRNASLHGQALAYYLMAVKSNPQLKNVLVKEFTEVFKMSCDMLLERGDMENLYHCFSQSQAVYPECAGVCSHMGSIMFRLGSLDNAVYYYKKALSVNQELASAQENLDNIFCHLVDRWHFLMLNDSNRNYAFKKAIERAMDSGCRSVLDIGSGTGILSMLAIRSGAKHVSACDDSSTMHQMSMEIVRTNHMNDKIRLLKKHSSELVVGSDIPCKVDLIVTETVDCGLFGEKILTTLSHAHKQLLSTSLIRKVIPRKATLYCCAIESAEIRRHHRCVYTAFRELDIGDMRLVDYTSQPADQLPSSDLFDPYITYDLKSIRGGFRRLSSITKILEVDFNDLDNVERLLDGYTFNKQITTVDQGHLDAVAMWFDLHLDSQTTLTSSPLPNPLSTSSVSADCWHQAVYPHSNSNTYVYSGKVLNLNVSCGNDLIKLQLDPVDKDICNAECDISPEIISPEFFYLMTDEIYSLNNIKFNSLMCDALNNVVNRSHSSDVAVLTLLPNFSVLPVQTRKLGAVTSIYVTENEYHEDIIKRLCAINQILCEMSLMSDSNLTGLEQCSAVGHLADCLVFDPIETNGVLRQHILEDVALARLTVLKPSDRTRIIPGRMKVMGVGINSLELTEIARVVDNTRTCNLNIADIVNAYQATTQRDIDFSTMQSTRLTELLELLTLDFSLDAPMNEGIPAFMNMRSSMSTNCISSSDNLLLHAVVYWFVMELDETTTASTIDPYGHWKQAAYMLPSTLMCGPGKRLDITTQIVDGCLSISVQG